MALYSQSTHEVNDNRRKRRASCQITTPANGLSLLDFLAVRFNYHEREEWRSLILDGRILVNNIPGAESLILTVGDRVEYLMRDLPEPAVNTDYTIVHRDSTLLVVNKPGNLPCHPAGPFFNHTLWALLNDREGIGQPYFINRLDRETSGLVLVCLDAEAASACQRQFVNNKVFKRYLAWVEGDFPPTLKADGWLFKAPDSVVRKKYAFAKERPTATPARDAATDFICLGYHNGLSLIEALPQSGRLHQIRATLLSLGFPVAGDKLYGVDENIYLRFIRGAVTAEDKRRLRFPRQALHAAELRIRHPHTQEQLNLLCPLPADIRLMVDFG